MFIMFVTIVTSFNLDYNNNNNKQEIERGAEIPVNWRWGTKKFFVSKMEFKDK